MKETIKIPYYCYSSLVRAGKTTQDNKRKNKYVSFGGKTYLDIEGDIYDLVEGGAIITSQTARMLIKQGVLKKVTTKDGVVK